MTDDDWKKAGVMVRLNANSKFVEVEPEGLNSLLRDRARLEWLIHNRARVWLQDGFYDVHNDSGDCIAYEFDSWRDAIDEAMRGE